MQIIKVTGPYLNIPRGAVVKLTNAQAAARIHALKKLKAANTYEVIEPTGFKMGEILGVKMEVTKDIAPLFEEVDAKQFVVEKA